MTFSCVSPIPPASVPASDKSIPTGETLPARMLSRSGGLFCSSVFLRVRTVCLIASRSVLSPPFRAPLFVFPCPSSQLAGCLLRIRLPRRLLCSLQELNLTWGVSRCQIDCYADFVTSPQLSSRPPALPGRLSAFGSFACCFIRANSPSQFRCSAITKKKLNCICVD